MKSSRFLIPLFALLLLISCSKDTDVPAERAITTIHYVASAKSSIDTKVSLNGENQYIFEDGDRLFLRYPATGDPELYGFLTLVSGAGQRTALFEGDLACAMDSSGDVFEPASGTPVSVTLVRASNDAMHTVSAGKVSTNQYPDDQFAYSLAEAVEQFSDFTCTGTFGSKEFILSQQTAFVEFALTLPGASFPSDVTVKLKHGDDVVRSVTVTPSRRSADTGAALVSFVLPFESNSTVFATSTSLTVQNGSDTPLSLDAIATAATLDANTYYTVRRTPFHWDGFAIKAVYDNTTINFKYYSGLTDGASRNITKVQYSLDEGAFWTDYDEAKSIILNTGERVCYRAQATVYNGFNSPNALFSTDKKCYIGGDMMSLMCNSSWQRSNTVAVDAFNSMFKSLTLIDIEAGNPLILSATTLNNKCYKNMFNGCTGLTRGPDLPASTLVGTGNSNGCYNAMFYGCSSLQYIKCLATSNIGQNNGTHNWMNGVPTGSGTFIKAAGASWPSNGVHSIPSGWTAQDDS